MFANMPAGLELSGEDVCNHDGTLENARFAVIFIASVTACHVYKHFPAECWWLSCLQTFPACLQTLLLRCIMFANIVLFFRQHRRVSSNLLPSMNANMPFFVLFDDRRIQVTCFDQIVDCLLNGSVLLPIR